MKRIVNLLLIALVSVLMPAVTLSDVDAQDRTYVTDAASEAATDIVNGRIVSTTSVEVDGEMHRASEIEITSTTKGDLEGTVIVETPGGERPDGAVVHVSHTPKLIPGELVQLALMPAAPKTSYVLPIATESDLPVYSVAGGSDGAWGLLPDGVGQADAVGDYTLTGTSWSSFAKAIPFKVNPAHSGVSANGTIAAVKEAFQTWEDDPGSTVDFRYSGTTTKSGLSLNDGVTTVSWVNPPAGAGWLAQSSWIANGDGSITGFDVRVSRNFNWSTSASSGKFDIATVIGHEVGHGLGFGHAPASSELMYLQIRSGTTKGLGSGDKSGARFLYPDPNFGKVEEPGHSVAANPSGDTVRLALRANGDLQISRDLGAGFSNWLTLGAGDWSSADVSIEPNGTVHLVAVKNFGQLYTRRWRSNGTWGGWVSHGTGWDSTTMPSISATSGTAFLGAIRSDGELHTAKRNTSWSGFTTHGGTGWAHVDVSVASDGDLWWAAVKDNGRLYVRKNLGSGWSGFADQGLATWSKATAPAISARSNGVIVAAVKSDGRLYTRRQVAGKWQGFQKHGAGSWASIDIAMTEGGRAWLAAHKTWGRLYTRGASSSGGWFNWKTQGQDTWSPAADASISIGANGQPNLLAVKTSGLLYSRERSSGGWGSWATDSGAVWAAGY